jgi:hypothetical protein
MQLLLSTRKVARSWRVASLAASVALALLLLQLPGFGTAPEALYGPGGVRPEGVRQGRLGSCYFHAVIAAMAQTKPQVLKDMIQSGSAGTFAVHFADGKQETAYPEDLRYTREIGYDLSDGLWVAVLFRAYAQRVLRESLLLAIDKSDLFPLFKAPAKDFVSTNDPLLLAYDRAIRAQVDQYGNIDRSKLESQLQEEMKPLPVSDEIKASLIKLLESGGFFDSLAEVIKQNGELFGAYRAVGQGGIADRVMQTFAGSSLDVLNESEDQAATLLDQVVKNKLPAAACSGGSRFYQLLAAGQSIPADAESWYVNAHCYTVLGYDSSGRTVTLRNPWARHPDPDGVFKLPLPQFVPAFRGIVTVQ